MSTRKRKADLILEEEKLRSTQRIRTVKVKDCDTNAPSCSSHTSATLHALLDFTPLTSHEEISARCDAIAKAVLYDCRLRIASRDAGHSMVYTDYEVMELEFYLHMPGLHEDPFTHGSDEQRRSGRWYFHRAPRRTAEPAATQPRAPTAAGGYRGGTRKGLDLTLGGPADSGRTSKFFATSSSNDKDPPRGGALLRSLRRVADNKVISGPSLLVDEILSVCKVSSITELVTSKWNGDTGALSSSPYRDAPSMYLYPVQTATRSQLEPPKVYRSTRIGIDLSHASIPLPSTSVSDTLSHPRAIFVTKPYRYFVHPHLLTSNGRGHTFFGVYQVLTAEVPTLDEAEIWSRVVKTTGLKSDTVARYRQEYRKALTSGSLAGFIGAKGKGAGSSPVPLLRMLGTLERLRQLPT